MNQQEETKYKIANAMKELMQTQSLAHIHVKDVVDHAHLTRQTFYRCFKGVNWYFERVAEMSFK